MSRSYALVLKPAAIALLANLRQLIVFIAVLRPDKINPANIPLSGAD